MTPFQYKKAHIWTSNTIWNINGYDYEYWKDTGNGTMIIANNAINGCFSCEWNNVNNILFRCGKKFNKRDKTHHQIGGSSITFDISYNSDNFFLSVYGWTVTPMVEWYIVEYYAAYKPASDLICMGTHNTDDGTYELYHTTRTYKPSIHGTKTFEQYWSIRTSRRSSGNVDVSAHFAAWESIGLTLGNLAEVSLSVESVQSSGSAVINANLLTIGGKSILMEKARN